MTVVGPIVLLFVLLVQACRLDGASDGVAYYIGKFEWAQLGSAEVSYFDRTATPLTFSPTPSHTRCARRA